MLKEERAKMGCCQSSFPGEGQATGYSPATTKPDAPIASKGGKSTASNKSSTAVGDAAIAQDRRITFKIVLPEVAGQKPIWMFFDKTKPVEKLIAGACKQAGLAFDKGKLVGSPERLNLFTLEGDVVRLDLEIEAHLGSTLQKGDTLIIEKGNRLDAAQLSRAKI